MMALSRSLRQVGARYIRLVIIHKNGVLPRTPTFVNAQSKTAFRSLFYKSPGTTMDALRIWKVLQFLGMDYCKIVRIRRRMKRFSYPWLTYCIPAAMILALGDFIAQYHLKPHAADRTFIQFVQEEWMMGQTLLFALLGFFPIGFIMSRWNLFLYRKLKCHGKFSFLWRKLLLDILILSPILLSLMILVYGNVFDKNLFYESTDSIKQTIQEKYWPALKQSMIFNIATRPLALFGIFYLAPIHLRRLFKTVYEIIFATYVTESVRENVQEPSSQTQNLSTGGDGGGGGIMGGIGSGIASKALGSASKSIFGGDQTPDSLAEQPLGRWARYKRWACRNREN